MKKAWYDIILVLGGAAWQQSLVGSNLAKESRSKRAKKKNRP